MGYRTFLREFNWLWCLPNLALMLWPLAFLLKLISDLTDTSEFAIDNGQAWEQRRVKQHQAAAVLLAFLTLLTA